MSHRSHCYRRVSETRQNGPSDRCSSRLIWVLMVLAGTLSVTARSEVPPQLPQIISFADSLQVDAQTSSRNRLPIVIFVSQHGCKFCHLLRERVLHPMIEAGALQGRAILREISLDDGFRLDDFDGRNVSGSEFASRYQTAVTPTLLFLDGRGREVSKRMVGINNVEYYGFYLEKASPQRPRQLRPIYDTFFTIDRTMISPCRIEGLRL